MKAKMTTSELKQYVIAEAKKLVKAEMLKEDVYNPFGKEFEDGEPHPGHYGDNDYVEQENEAIRIQERNKLLAQINEIMHKIVSSGLNGGMSTSQLYDLANHMG